MKKVVIVFVLIAVVCAGVWYSQRFGNDSRASTAYDPDAGELCLSSIFGVQIGRDTVKDPMFPAINDAQIPNPKLGWYCVDCQSPDVMDDGTFPFRPKGLIVDRASKKIVWAWSESLRYDNMKDCEAGAVAATMYISEAGVGQICQGRRKMFRCAFDLVDKNGQPRTLLIEKQKDTPTGTFWLVFYYFASDSCFAKSDMNDMPVDSGEQGPSS